MLSFHDNQQAEEAFSAWWLSYKQGMKQVVADKQPY